MSVRIEFPKGPTVDDAMSGSPAPEKGIAAIELDDDGRTLTVQGWFDQFAKWEAMVELSDDQAEELREGLRR